MKKIFAGLILTQFFAGVVFAAPVVKDEVIWSKGRTVIRASDIL